MTDRDDWTLDLTMNSGELLELALDDLAAVRAGDDSMAEDARRTRAARAFQELAQRLRSHQDRRDQTPAVWIEPGAGNGPDCYRISE
jgi:hypothetical protein